MDIKAFVFVLIMAQHPYAKDFDTKAQCLSYGQRMTKLMIAAQEKHFLYACETREEYLKHPNWPRIDRGS